jgi:hypothetical protein
MRRSGGVVQAGHRACFLVIGVVAVRHPDAGIVRDQGDGSSLRVLRPRFWPLQDQSGTATAAIERTFVTYQAKLVVVVEKNEGVNQAAVDEVSTAVEGVMDRGPERVLCIHDARDVPHCDAGVVDPFERVVE